MSEPTLVAATERYVAVNKPSGWLVHPAGTDAPDLLAWLGSIVHQHGFATLAPVHRLDLGTSGLTLFAPPDHAPQLAQLFADGAVDKHYDALVFGRPRNKGIVRRPLQDARRDGPIEAITRYRTRERFRKCAWLHVRPETGRKHQIRRHLQGIGHAVVGDTRYRPRGRPTVPAFPGRLWLHASRLDLPDATLEAPLPPALSGHLETLRAREAD